MAGPAQAAERDAAPASQGQTWDSYIEQAQRDFSTDIVDTGRWLDSLFGSGVFEADPEGSVLRLGLSSDLKRGGLDVSPEIQLSLELPRTEERFSFYLDNTVEDAFGGAEDAPIGVAEAVNPAGDEESSDDFIAGVEYVDDLAEYVNFRADTGVIVQWPPNPYARLRLRRSYFLGDWQLRLGETVFWNRDRGRGSETEMLWQHPMPEDHFFRSQTKATYLERAGEFFYGQQFLITHRLAPMEALLYRLGVYARSHGGDPFTNVVYELRWRRPLYKDWVLMELRPGVEFPEEEDGEAQPRVFLTVEALFGDRDEYEY